MFYSFREESSEEDEEEQKKKTKKETKRIKKAVKKIASRKKKEGSEDFDDVIDADFDDVSDMDVTGKSKARKKKDKKELTGAAMSGSSVSEILTGAGFSSDTSSAVTITTQLTGNEALNENSDESPMRHQTRRGYSDMSPETLLTGAMDLSDESELMLTGASGLSNDSDQPSRIEATKTTKMSKIRKRKERRGGSGSSDASIVTELTGTTGFSDTSDVSLLTGATGFSEESDLSLTTELTGGTGLSEEDSYTLLTGATGFSDESSTLLTGVTGLSDDDSYTLLTGATGLSDTSDMSLTTLLTGATDLSDISLTTELTGASGLSDSEDLSQTTLLTGTTGLTDEDDDFLTGADIDDVTSDVSDVTLTTTDVSSVSSATSGATTDATEITETTPTRKRSETSGASVAADSLGPVTIVEPEHKNSNSMLTRAERRARRRARRQAASVTSQDEPHKLALPRKTSKRRRRRKSRSRSRSERRKRSRSRSRRRSRSKSDKEVRKVNPRSGNVRDRGVIHKPITLTLRPSPINVVTKDTTNKTEATSVTSGITMSTTDVEPVTINTNASNTNNVSMAISDKHAQFEWELARVDASTGGKTEIKNLKSTKLDIKRDKEERNLRVKSTPNLKVTNAASRSSVHEEKSDTGRHGESTTPKSRSSCRPSGGRITCKSADPMKHYSGLSGRPSSARSLGKSEGSRESGRISRSRRQDVDEKDLFSYSSKSRRSVHLVDACPGEERKDLFSTGSESRRSGHLVGGCPDEDKKELVSTGSESRRSVHLVGGCPDEDRKELISTGSEFRRSVHLVGGCPDEDRKELVSSGSESKRAVHLVGGCPDEDRKDFFSTGSDSRRSGHLVGGCPDEDRKSLFSTGSDSRRSVHLGGYPDEDRKDLSPIDLVSRRSGHHIDPSEKGLSGRQTPRLSTRSPDTTRKFDSSSSIANVLRSNSATSGKIRSRSESRPSSRAQTTNFGNDIAQECNTNANSDASTRKRSYSGACAVVFKKTGNSGQESQPRFVTRPSVVAKILDEIARRKCNQRTDSRPSQKKRSSSRTESRASGKERSGSGAESRTSGRAKSKVRRQAQIVILRDHERPNSKDAAKTRSGSRSAFGTFGNPGLNSELNHHHGNVQTLKKYFEHRINLLAATMKPVRHAKEVPNGNGNNMETDGRSTSGTNLPETSGALDGVAQPLSRKYNYF